MPEEIIKSKIELKQSPTNGDTYFVHYNDNHYATVSRNPFANCQTLAIAYFENICRIIEKDLVCANKLFQDIEFKLCKPQIAIDVLVSNCKIIDKYFSKKSILVKQEYTNNTGSKMCLYLINFTRSK